MLMVSTTMATEKASIMNGNNNGLTSARRSRDRVLKPGIQTMTRLSRVLEITAVLGAKPEAQSQKTGNNAKMLAAESSSLCRRERRPQQKIQVRNNQKRPGVHLLPRDGQVAASSRTLRPSATRSGVGEK